MADFPAPTEGIVLSQCRLRRLVGERRALPHRAHRPRRRDSLLPARPRRPPDRGRPEPTLTGRQPLPLLPAAYFGGFERPPANLLAQIANPAFTRPDQPAGVPYAVLGR